MNSSRVLTGALIVGAVAVASMFAAAPASAATLPTGQKITVIDQWTDQFYNVNPANAESAPFGTAVALAPEIEAVDVDDAGLGYAIGTAYDYAEELGDLNEPIEAWFYKADANTGTLTDGKKVTIDTGVEIKTVANECSSIDYTKGVIVAACFSYDGETGYGTTYLGTIDPATAVLKALTTIVTDAEEEDYNTHFTAIAVNPVDGKLYGFSDDDGPQSWVITLGQQPVSLGYLDNNYWVWGADFDRSGQLWLTVERFVVPTALANESTLELATFDFASNAAVVIENFSSADPYEIDDNEAITVWGALAATGSVASATPAIAASGILLLGALLAAGTMVLRRRNADA